MCFTVLFRNWLSRYSVKYISVVHFIELYFKCLSSSSFIISLICNIFPREVSFGQTITFRQFYLVEIDLCIQHDTVLFISAHAGFPNLQCKQHMPVYYDYKNNVNDIESNVVMSCADSSMRVSQVVKGEMSAKTTYQKSAKGPVLIGECSADGKYIMIENSGRKVTLIILFHLLLIYDNNWLTC